MSGITSVNHSTSLSYQTSVAAASKANEPVENKKPTEDPVDTFEKSQPTAGPKVYTRDTATVNALKADAENRYNALRTMVERLLTNQGLTARDVLEAFQQGRELEVSIDDATRAEAAALVAEDGELGWKKVSEDILNFARALSGGDPSKIETLRKAVQKGFDAAEKILGELPEVSKKTYEAVMKGFDDWAAEAKGETEEE